VTSAVSHARRLLDVVVTRLGEAGRPAPERRYVTPGAQSVWDDEQLTVAVLRPSVPGAVAQAAGARARPVPGPRHAELRLEVVRCIPAGTVTGDGSFLPPDPEACEQAAEDLLADAGVLSALTPAELTGVAGRPATLGVVQTMGPEGGLAGVFVVVLVPL